MVQFGDVRRNVNRDRHSCLDISCRDSCMESGKGSSSGKESTACPAGSSLGASLSQRSVCEDRGWAFATVCSSPPRFAMVILKIRLCQRELSTNGVRRSTEANRIFAVKLIQLERNNILSITNINY